MRKLKNGYVYQMEEKLEDVIHRLNIMRGAFQQYSELEEKYYNIAKERIKNND